MTTAATDRPSDRPKPAIAFVLAGANPPQLGPMLEEHFRVHQLPVVEDMSREVTAFAEDVRALVTATLVGADKRLIDALPNLELIVCTGGHVDHIDRDAAWARGIHITNAPGVSAPDVADMSIALMLAVARRLCEGDRFVRTGHWLRGDMPLGRRVYGRKLGIVGLGGIGRIVARRAEGLEMDIAYYGPNPKEGVSYPHYEDVTRLAADVDFLTLHCKSGPATRHLIDAEVLRALGPDGFLINAARGDVVDEAALIQALKDGTIAGAGLDVYENEPHVPEELLGMDNVVLGAHHSAYSFEAKQIMADLTLANVRAHFDGKPLVTPVT